MARNTKAKAVDTEIDLDALIEGVAPVAEVEAQYKATGFELSSDPEFVAELLMIRFIHDVRSALDRLGWSQAELARRMNKKAQYVSRVLDAERRENLTLATMAEFACALGIDLEIRTSAAAESDNFEQGAQIISIDFEAAASEQEYYQISNGSISEETEATDLEVADVYNFGS